MDLALDREKMVEEFDFDIDAQDESDNGGPAWTLLDGTVWQSDFATCV